MRRHHQLHILRKGNKMKKTISALLFVVLFVGCIFTTGCSAGEITVALNGNELSLRQPPVIVDGRTLVPFRGIFEALGAEVSWDGKTKTVTGVADGKSVTLTIDKTEAYVDGEKRVLDVAPCIVNDYTMVPVRFVSEAFGANVQWDSRTRTVSIIYNSNLTVVFADVGQGDCELVICDGETMLIDGGNADKSSTVVAILKKYGINHIDYLISTHAHADHCGGLSGALSTVSVGKVLAPVTGSDSKTYKNFEKGVALQGLKITNPQPGDTFSLGGGKVVVLGPVNEELSDINDTSIVLKLTYGSRSFLFTGDCEADGERDILETGADVSADVLKVGHHGAETSTSYSFLREVMPEYAVISVGKDNSYGHPTDAALSRLRDVGAVVYRTDIQGDIVLVCDGSNIDITTHKNSGVLTNPTEKPADGEVIYIGNRRSRKFHKSTCSGLPYEDNREYFSSRSDAANDGYEPCKICKP